MERLIVDTRTIIAFLAIGNAAFTLILLVYAGSLSRARDCRLFAAGKILQATAWVLMGLRGIIPDFASGNLGNGLIFCGFALEAVALSSSGWRGRFWRWAFGALVVAAISAFSAVPPSAWVGVASASMAAIFFLAIAAVLSSGRSFEVKATLCIMYLMNAVLFSVRSSLGFAQGFGLLANSPLQGLLFLSLYLLMMVGGITFLLIQKEEAEGRLAASEAKYRSLVETANEAIVIIQDERIVYANNRSAELFKRPLGEVVGKSMYGLIPEERRSAVRERYADSLDPASGLDRFDLPIEAESGEATWVLASISRTEFEGKAAVLAFLADIGERKRQEERIKQLNAQLEVERNRAELLAVTDGLTGLANRRSFDERLVAEFYRLKRSGDPFSLAMLDIDHFKIFNDKLGHQSGDLCLKRIGAAITGALRRSSDFAARYGGEEFVIVMPETERDGAQANAERIRIAIEGLGIPHPSGGVVTASVGAVTVLPSIMAVPERIVELADAALYRAKAAGRNRVEIAEPEALEGDVLENLARLAWREADACGDPTIDAEHRGLIEEANLILEAIAARRGKEELSARIRELVGNIEDHFSDEERILERCSFPGLDDHRAIHDALRRRVASMVAEYESGGRDIERLFGFVAYEIVLKHMHVEDREFFRYIAKR